MPEPNLSPQLIQFIQATLPSYEGAVVLVHVAKEPERTWTVQALVAAIGPESIGHDAVRTQLEHFSRAGLMEALPGDQFRYQPRSEELRGVVEELCLAYDKRPVTLIRALDSAARARIQSFADSFKLKRD